MPKPNFPNGHDNGHHNGHGNQPPPVDMPPPPQDPGLSPAGILFDDATTQLIGGIHPGNTATVTSDLMASQADVFGFYNAHPELQNAVAGVHLQEIGHQFNLELGAVGLLAGTSTAEAHLGAFAPKDINDIQRDIIDIVQGDDVLAGHLPNGGFTVVPPLLVGPAPFQDNAEQTTFLNNFVADANNFANQANAVVQAHADPADLIAQLHTFAANADAFSVAQGGLYSARFDNELRLEGNNGVDVAQIVNGLQHGNADLVHAATQVLVANAADFAGNNTAGVAAMANNTPAPAAPAAPAAADASPGHGHDQAMHAQHHWA